MINDNVYIFYERCEYFAFLYMKAISGLVRATLHLDCLVVNQPPAVHTVYKILVIQLLACDWLIVLFFSLYARHC